MNSFLCIAAVFRCFDSSLALSRSASCVARNRFGGVVAQSPLNSSGAPGRWRPGLLIT
jgi:hypothetical protein